MVFKTHLSRALEEWSKYYYKLDDDRVKIFLDKFIKRNVKEEYKPKEGYISHRDVPLLKSHFPLCMQNLYNNAEKDAHLKHEGRLQMIPFLKAIGLSVEEALVFWRKLFHRMSEDQYKKGSYAYYIKYNYGLEGKRKDAKPRSCLSLLSGKQPGVGEHHGCPFKTFDSSSLKALIECSLMDRPVEVKSIVKLAKDSHYQVACRTYFEATKLSNGKECDSIHHPNQYYDLSKKASDDFHTEEDIDNNTIPKEY
jgi:DNA primase large subunit